MRNVEPFISFMAIADVSSAVEDSSGKTEAKLKQEVRVNK